MWSDPEIYESQHNKYNPVYMSFENDRALYFTNLMLSEIRTTEWKDSKYKNITRLPDEIN